MKAMLIGCLFGITSEQRLIREIQVNLSYRRFLGLDLESEVWHATTFTKNRNQRFKESEIFRWLFDHAVAGAVTKGLVTGHHISQDGTLVRANCSFKSIEPITVTRSPKQYRKHVAKENPDTAEPAPAEAPADRTSPPTAGAGDGGRNPSQREAGTMKPAQQNRNECHPRRAHPAGAVRPRADRSPLLSTARH
ncbi:MAG: transposase [Candidatus Eisenbacteria bacterium]|nr:transposase [Candidatus Eisenbacteria bacterium]